MVIVPIIMDVGICIAKQLLGFDTSQLVPPFQNQNVCVICHYVSLCWLLFCAATVSAKIKFSGWAGKCLPLSPLTISTLSTLTVYTVYSAQDWSSSSSVKLIYLTHDHFHITRGHNTQIHFALNEFHTWMFTLNLHILSFDSKWKVQPVCHDFITLGLTRDMSVLTVRMMLRGFLFHTTWTGRMLR